MIPQIDKKLAAQLLRKSFPILAKPYKALAIGAKHQIRAAYDARGLAVPDAVIKAGLTYHCQSYGYLNRMIRAPHGAPRHNIDGTRADSWITEGQIAFAKAELARRAAKGRGRRP